MKRPRYIQRNGYHALDWQHDSGLVITHIWERFPDLVIGRYLVNTSFDSGFLTLSDSEQQDGWRMIGKLAHSPPIRSTQEIPHDQFDEWLVFDQPVQVTEFESMVSYTSFTPIDFAWEEKRERFWEQIGQLQPLHVIAVNDGVYLLSKDGELVSKLLNTDW